MTDVDLDNGGDRWFLDSSVGDRFPAWTRGNAADVFPEPISPLAQTLYLRPGLSAGLRDAYISMGVLDWDEVEHPENPEFFKVFGGYLYNPLSLTRLLGARMPGVTPELIDRRSSTNAAEVPPYRAEPWHESERHTQLLGGVDALGHVRRRAPRPRPPEGAGRADPRRATRPRTPDRRRVDRPRPSLVPVLQTMFETGMVVSSLSSLGPGPCRRSVPASAIPV